MSYQRALGGVLCALAAACSVACSAPAQSNDAKTLRAVGAENFYANVIAQVGGSHVQVVAVLSNPNTDPHSYESSTVDASAVAGADLIVQNGLGYDAFMRKLEDASPNATRTVIDVGQTLGYATGDNPHLWFDPATMPRVATMIADELSKRDPSHAAEYRHNAAQFTASLRPWTERITAFKRAHRDVPVAVTEPVFNHTADALGLKILTPPSFQLAVEEGNDPAPQDVATVNGLLSGKVKAFIYNQQTVEPTTAQLLDLARKNRVPVVGVYETMPAGMTYQRWMVAEVDAVSLAITKGRSTEKLR